MNRVPQGQGHADAGPDAAAVSRDWRIAQHLRKPTPTSAASTVPLRGASQQLARNTAQASLPPVSHLAWPIEPNCAPTAPKPESRIRLSELYVGSRPLPLLSQPSLLA
ncbi:hypothetical protein PMIN06_011672 [Paraphaeosphaeria minitans]|uniref:Uncharacterized protein n=1 Tax=Paraphaeosphaeria minitans TaxID=565426 RepID=A0A9P6GBK1_9PLEO|nr:hypothetical protein PMIN01_10125 [Paraphaeosphaeria minitans]